MAWIRRQSGVFQPPKLSRTAAAERVRTTAFAPSPAVALLTNADGSALARLPDALLALVSRFLSNRPETKLMEDLIQAGRVPQPILVEMARMSCSGRRLEWQKGRFMSTPLKCHRAHCRWRRMGHECITHRSKYTTAAYIKTYFRVRGVPRCCWNQRVLCEDGRERPFLETVFDRLPVSKG